MAMTLRLDEDLDAELAQYAAREHLSKQFVVQRATRDFLANIDRAARTKVNMERVIAENRGLLERLRET